VAFFIIKITLGGFLMASPHSTLNLPKDLGDGLVLRLATPADTEPLAEFNTRIHLEDGEPGNFLTDWTRVLMSGRHPTMKPEDFVVVEDTGTGQIVSATCLIPQVWQYDSIPFAVGRPELVGTDPAYRRRGLVRTIFEVIHQLSDAYGHQLQGITGIAWYYRQFGYEYALDLGGGRDLHVGKVPELKKNETEPYQIRPATLDDIPTLLRLYQKYAEGKLVTVPLNADRWRYEMEDRNGMIRVNCITMADNTVVGTFICSRDVWRGNLFIWDLTVDEGISLRAVLPTVTRALKAYGEERLTGLKDKDGSPQKLNNLGFGFGADHPAYQAFDAKLDALRPPYGWYIRVADVPGFLRHIAPALEKRLANSVMSGYTGELKLNFYRDGLRLAFEQGKLTTAEKWQEPNERDENDKAGAGFPPLVFLQLLFGYRSLKELRYAYPDCWADEEPTLLLNALFPRQSSWVMMLS